MNTQSKEIKILEKKFGISAEKNSLLLATIEKSKAKVEKQRGGGGLHARTKKSTKPVAKEI